MIARLARIAASYASEATCLRINARHWFDGFPMNANDNGVI